MPEIELDPLIWSVKTLDGKRGAYCLICNDNKFRWLKHCVKHTETTKHQRNATRQPRPRNRSPSPTEEPIRPPSPTAGGDPRQSLSANALSHLLYTLAYPEEGIAGPSDVPFQPNSPSPPRPSGYDWNLYEVHNDGVLEDTAERRGVSMIAQALFEHFDDVSISSEDELAERSEEEEILDDDNDIPSSEPRRRERAHQEQASREWYPWPDKVTCTLDILMHLPRSAFSQRQLDLFLWLLRVNHVNDVPSIKSMQAVNERLQKLCGIESILYDGPLGHRFYMNSLPQIVAQEMANPNVRPHLWFYPEDAGKSMSEARQGQRWLNEVPNELLTPMARINNHDFYIFEPAMTRNGQCYVPFRWVMREGDLHAKAWPMAPVATAQGPAWRVVISEEVDVLANDFLKNFLELCEMHHDIEAIIRKEKMNLGLSNCFVSPAREQKLMRAIKLTASSVRNNFREDLLKSVTKKRTSLTAFTYKATMKYKRGGVGEKADNAYLLHNAILRRFVLDNPELAATKEVAEAEGEGLELSDIEVEEADTQPKTKRRRTGRVTKGEDFWGRVDLFFAKEIKSRGNSFTTPQWKEYLNDIIQRDDAIFDKKKASPITNRSSSPSRIPMADAGQWSSPHPTGIYQPGPLSDVPHQYAGPSYSSQLGNMEAP